MWYFAFILSATATRQPLLRSVYIVDLIVSSFVSPNPNWILITPSSSQTSNKMYEARVVSSRARALFWADTDDSGKKQSVCALSMIMINDHDQWMLQVHFGWLIRFQCQDKEHVIDFATAYAEWQQFARLQFYGGRAEVPNKCFLCDANDSD